MTQFFVILPLYMKIEVSRLKWLKLLNGGYHIFVKPRKLRGRV